MAHSFVRDNSVYEYMNQAALTGPPITMAAWFSTTDMDYNQVIMSIANKDSEFNSFFILAGSAAAGDPAYICIRDNSGATYTATSNGYSSGTWHHICGVFAANNDRSIYLDADVANKGTSNVSRSPSGVNKTAVGVNCRSTLQWFMNGTVAEAAIWDAALTEAEIAILAKGYSPLFVRPQNLVEYWHMFVLMPRSRMTGNALIWANSPPGKAVHTGIIYPVRPAVLMAAGGMTPLLLRAIEKY